MHVRFADQRSLEALASLTTIADHVLAVMTLGMRQHEVYQYLRRGLGG
jgi:hypothetical protein